VLSYVTSLAGGMAVHIKPINLPLNQCVFGNKKVPERMTNTSTEIAWFLRRREKSASTTYRRVPWQKSAALNVSLKLICGLHRLFCIMMLYWS